MNRQLYANGGIMQVAPREKFGIGSSLKKFVRKIIPNEVADIAVKAAPFVAPFNPAVAAAMAGIGSFDQTGSIGDSLKRGALTYGGGQLARYAGGAGFQGNPFASGGAFTPTGFTSGFSSPIGTDTGLGKFFSNRGTEGVQGISVDSGRAGDSASALSRSTANVPTEALASEVSYVPGGTEALASELSYVPNATNALVDASDMALVGDVKQAASQEFNLFKTAAEKVQNFDYREAGNKALELGKKFGKAIYTDKDGNLDKAALLGTIAFAGSYAEAKALAADAGVEITPEEYDEAAKADKKEEYATYLTNFFGGQKDGGRIGYESGANEMIKTQLLEEIMPDTSTEEMIMIMTEDGPKMVKKSDFEAMSGMFRDTTTSLYGDPAKGRPVPEFANGGRIGLKFGSEPEDAEIGIMSIDVEAGDDEDEEDMKMAGITFSSAEKSYLFKKLGGAGGSDRSYTMPQLYRVLSNPDRYAADAVVLKEIAIMGLGKKDGGRIGLRDGTDAIRDIDFLLEGQDEFSMQEFGKKVSELNSAERKELADKIYSYELKFKNGGRIGLKGGSGSSNRVAQLMLTRSSLLANDPDEDVSFIDIELERDFGIKMKAEGGIMEAKIPTGNMRKNNAGVVERDYRDEGGFVPVGIKERADDVPAMLSKNEFVMTADAVRGIGNGSVEEGSKKLYNTMKQAEKVGKA